MEQKSNINILFDQALKDKNNELAIHYIPHKKLDIIAATNSALDAKNKDVAALLIPLALMNDDFDLKKTIFKMIHDNNKEAVEVIINTTGVYISEALSEAKKIGQKDIVDMLNKYISM